MQFSSSEKVASVAQSVEQRTENPRVVGSIPTGATILGAGLAHLVERHLAKVEVASSNLVTRSKILLNEHLKMNILSAFLIK